MDDRAAIERWSAAAQLASGVEDCDLSSRRVRILLWVSAFVAGCVVVGLVLALIVPLTGQRSNTPDDVTVLVLVGQFVFLVLAFIVGIGGFVWAHRHGFYITRWRHAASPLNKDEKRLARRQIAGRAQIDEHLPVVVAIAEQDRRAAVGVAPIYGALMLLAVSTALATRIELIRYVEVAVVLLFMVAAIQLTFVYRRAGRFIEAHAAWAERRIQT